MLKVSLNDGREDSVTGKQKICKTFSSLQSSNDAMKVLQFYKLVNTARFKSLEVTSVVIYYNIQMLVVKLEN